MNSILRGDTVFQSPKKDCLGSYVTQRNWKDLDFGAALAHLKSGSRMTRSSESWKGKEIFLKKPGLRGAITRPMVCVATDGGHVDPWTPTHEDLLATDWRTAVAALVALLVGRHPDAAASARALLKQWWKGFV